MLSVRVVRIWAVLVLAVGCSGGDFTSGDSPARGAAGASDAGAPSVAGMPGAGVPGASGAPASAGSPGVGGQSGSAGMSPTSGSGGMPAGGRLEATAGAPADDGGEAPAAGDTSGPPPCEPATGKITVKPLTYLADADTLTVGDGVNPSVVFEFDLEPADGVASGHARILFDGTEGNFGLAQLITDAINTQNNAGNLRVRATTAAQPDSGEGGAGVTPPPLDNAVVDLANSYAGALGNVKLTDTIGNPNLTTSGMSGGVGDVNCH